MITILTVTTALVCIFLILVVLVQTPGNSIFNNGIDNKIFGSQKGSRLLDSLTWGLASALFIFCLLTASLI